MATAVVFLALVLPAMRASLAGATPQDVAVQQGGFTIFAILGPHARSAW